MRIRIIKIANVCQPHQDQTTVWEVSMICHPGLQILLLQLGLDVSVGLVRDVHHHAGYVDEVLQGDLVRGPALAVEMVRGVHVSPNMLVHADVELQHSQSGLWLFNPVPDLHWP